MPPEKNSHANCASERHRTPPGRSRDAAGRRSGRRHQPPLPLDQLLDPPQQALELAAGGLATDVLVTDIALPDMTGFELAERLCGALPRLKVLYVSGYDPEAYKGRGLLRAEINFLPKPFDPDQLLHTLRRVVARG